MAVSAGVTIAGKNVFAQLAGGVSGASGVQYVGFSATELAPGSATLANEIYRTPAFSSIVSANQIIIFAQVSAGIRDASGALIDLTALKSVGLFGNGATTALGSGTCIGLASMANTASDAFQVSFTVTLLG